ncbi:MAG: hypothetical protein IMF14_08740, partial [Proteobacteria bacterium]|nr:hypothetical protein [Pseudomonadota bacterium]
DTDTNLTAKVSETYKRLGEIDNAYKSLLDISTRIDSDIKKLNGDIGTVAEQSSSGIKNLEKATIEQSISQSNEFSQKNKHVVSRVNQLVETSKMTSEMLDQKIQHTTDSILLIEKNLISEIDELSSSTDDKTRNIIDDAEQTKAKVLKLQAVDEAIIKRATMLEITSAELGVQSQMLQSSTDMLQASTESLSEGLFDLAERTRELEQLSKEQAESIDGLLKESAELAGKVVDLSHRESSHFNMASAGFLLLLIMAVIIYFVQQGQFDSIALKLNGQSEVIDTRLVDIKQAQSDASDGLSQSVVDLKQELEKKVEMMNAAMQDDLRREIAAGVELVSHEVQGLQDHVDSVEGRLNLESINGRLGDDNIIHGEQWLRALPAENFVIQMAYVDSSDQLYELAQYYNYYLKDTLSYFDVTRDGVTAYVLLSGNYPSHQEAEAALQAMPRYIDMQRPLVRDVASVQQFISR